MLRILLYITGTVCLGLGGLMLIEAFATLGRPGIGTRTVSGGFNRILGISALTDGLLLVAAALGQWALAALLESQITAREDAAKAARVAETPRAVAEGTNSFGVPNDLRANPKNR